MVDTAQCMTLRRRIQQRLDALGLSMRKASLRAGLGTHFVRDLMDNPDQSPKADNLERLAAALETTSEWLLAERGEEAAQGVPVMGVVGAGSHYKPFEDQGNLDYVERPPGTSDVLGAAYVKGHSQHPVYRDGEVIYFSEMTEAVDNLIGEDVIAELSDGSMLLKTLQKGTALRRYNLLSHNAPMIENAEVIRASAVRFVDRRRHRR